MRPPPRKKCPVSFVLEETFQFISIVSFTLDVTNCVKTNFFHGQKIYSGKKSPHSSFGQNSSYTKAVMLELQIQNEGEISYIVKKEIQNEISPILH